MTPEQKEKSDRIKNALRGAYPKEVADIEIYKLELIENLLYGNKQSE